MSFWKKNKQDGNYSNNQDYQHENEDMPRENDYGDDGYNQNMSNVYGMNGKRVYDDEEEVETEANMNDVIIYRPTEYEQSQTIIDYLKLNKTIFVNLTEIETPVAQRILDFIYGGVYALGGDLKKAGPNMFVLAPANVNLTNASEGTDTADDNVE